MKHYYPALFFLILLSCTAKQKVPKDIMPLETTPAMLWDMMQTDALLKLRSSADSGFKRFDTSMQLYGQVLKLHNITPERFKKSIRYYQSRPDLLQIIFDSLQRRADVPVLPVDSTKTQ